jgi:diacylglycerol kinase family enzyme
MAKRRRRPASRACRQRKDPLRDRWFAIVNPLSGGNRNGARFAATLEGLRRVAAKTVLTSGPGHAFELAMEAQAYGGVVAVGGDGTLFEILKGIDRKEQRIALIPAGRGNSLARDLGLMHRHAPLDVIHWEQARFIDLMEAYVTTADDVQSRHLSASTVALGYPAAVTLHARKLARLGRMSYAAAAAATRPVHFGARIQYEDETPREVWLSGFVANNTRHVANFQAFRQASCSDGLFETMEMDAGIAKQTLHNLSALSGTGAYEPYAPRQARIAKIQLDTPQSLMMDGELFPDVVSVDIRILPSELVCNGRGAS